MSLISLVRAGLDSAQACLRQSLAPRDSLLFESTSMPSYLAEGFSNTLKRSLLESELSWKGPSSLALSYCYAL